MTRFGRLHARPAAAPMHEINVTPLVDVMLVLLVLFLLGAPLAVHRLALQLPAVPAHPAAPAAASLRVEIDAEGRLRVEGRLLPGTGGDAPTSALATLEALEAAARAVARSTPQAEVQIRADTRAPYGRVAEVIGAVQAAGLSRIGLVATPATP
jgi:biopolymer transport protein ExbD